MAHTPYGYVIREGYAILDACLAAQVKKLFSDYVAGGSLTCIASDNQIHRSHASIGNMLQDRRYLGDSYYPVLVDKSLWEEAQAERKRRATALGRDRRNLAVDGNWAMPFFDLIFCDACGSEFRNYSRHDRNSLMCSRYTVNKEITCRSPKITEGELESAFQEILSKIDLHEVSEKPEQLPTKIEQVYSDPFKQAEYAYSICQVDDFDYMTAKLITALADRPDHVDGGFMRRIVRRITIAHDGSIQFELINHKIIRREIKSNGSPASIHHSGDT